MRKLGIMFRTGLLGAAAAAVVLVGTVPEAAAARNPNRASVRCRKVIGQNILRVVSAGLRTIQTCHARRLKGRASGNCNELTGAGSYERARQRAAAVIASACGETPVLDNYRAGSPTTASSEFYGLIETLLEESGEDLQDSDLPPFEGDRASVRQRRKCHGMVGKGRTAVVQGVLKAAVRCQQRRDKRAESFGPIDPSCLAGAGGAGNRTSRQIQRACNSIDGLQVGSCATLPGCLLSATESTGQRLARLTFGGPTQCGNGLEELGEECDDGNTDSNDSCTAACMLPECGDRIVSPGEECDDGGATSPQTDDCLADCRPNTCGDGFQNPAVEECDDGNTAPGDGCFNCRVESAVCGQGGAAATIEFQIQPPGVSIIGLVELLLRYPAALSIPGSGAAASVRSRVTSLVESGQPVRLAPSDVDTNADGTDDQVKTEVTGDLPPGPVERIHFDCEAGVELRRTEFGCTIGQFLNEALLPFPPAAVDLVSCQVMRLESVATTTTTTTSTTITIPPTTTSSTIPPPPTCGDGEVQPPETCDDAENPGGNCDFCACPGDCIIDACEVTATPIPATVVVSTPFIRNLRIELDYPEAKVELPGEDFTPDVTPLVPGTFQSFDLGSGPVPVGHGHALRIVAADAFDYGQQQIATLNFVACAGAQPPVPSDFACFVREAGSEAGPVDGVTCAVTIP